LNKKSCQNNIPRISLSSGEIQVNFCKNPVCDNYGVAASQSSRGDNYHLTAGSKKPVAKLICKCCGEQFPVKSNQGIDEEINRLGAYLKPLDEPTCPSESCNNYTVGISAGKTAYQSFGKTKSGSPRYRCKSCKKSFSVKQATTGQKEPHKNKLIFKLLMNKSPFRRICEVADVTMPTIYSKIDFLHRQCLAFAGERERRLMNKHLERVYVSTDRQEYVVNWSRREDKRNVKLTAIGSADNHTGYVFGMHLNYDSSIDHDLIEVEALADEGYKHAYRRHARLWLQSDYDDSVMRSQANKNISVDLTGEIKGTYNQATSRDDVEVSEALGSANRLPARGMQVHSDYTMYGHFFHLHKLFGCVDKVRFFLDQDSGIRAACLSAFQKEVSNRTCDAFYVRLNKNLTVDEKRRVLADSRKVFKAAQVNHPDLTENEIKLILIKERMTNMTEIGQWKDRWLSHPFPNMSEPEKAICYLTNYNDYDEDHQAWLYNKASMHAIDCFFMQVRRRLSLLERPISSASSTARRWFGYSAYNPESIIKLLDIFRIYYNYCLDGKDTQTPAMRIGLAKGVVPLEDVIYFRH
jgi:transposase-like protein